MKRLSVVIANYNYEQFVGEAVESALAVDWPDVEVVVVDDGSTDRSLEVLAGFGDRITVIPQENLSSRVASNKGFATSSGDAVIFLDSDDVLEPSIAREAAAVWRPGVSKVQVQMSRIDGDGESAGRPFPDFPTVPTPEQMRHWMTETSAYPTPVNSGNVYARSYLDQIFPLAGPGDTPDSACLSAAPYLGDVLTVPRPLVRYRVHGGNRSSLRADPNRLLNRIERAYLRHRYAMEISGQIGADADPSEVWRPLRRSRHLLQMRVAAHRVCPGPTAIATDNRVQLLRDTVVNVGSPGPESLRYRLTTAAWSLVTLFAPLPVARRLIHWRFL